MSGFQEEFVIDDRVGGVFRVNRQAMVSDEVFADERRQLWDKCWLYVGHESEVAKPNDYVRRGVGGRPLILLRDAKGQVRVFFNTCTHRGATICREDAGNTRVFQCFYHAWSFDTTGRLVVTPGADGYAEGFDKADYNLRSPAKVAEYRGLWFVCYDPDAVELADYLGPAACEYIDLVMDQAAEGMRIVEGTHRYTIKANWKLMVENSIDGYHAPTVHATYIDFVKDSGGATTNSLEAGTGTDLGNGHSVIESPAAWARPIAYWEPIYGAVARDDVAAIKADLVERHGQERADRMAGTFRNLLIFPNLIINDVAAVTIRRIEPFAPGKHMSEAWAFAPREETAGSERLKRRLDSFLTFLGPGGFASPDDVEALESCQQGFAATEVEWSDISRGMARTATSQDELQIRTFWRAYASMMDGAGFPARVTEIEAPPVELKRAVGQ